MMPSRTFLSAGWWAVSQDPETGMPLKRPMYILGNLRDGVRMDLKTAIEHGLLYDVRQARDDTQSDVAHVLDVTRETISRWENNHDTPQPGSLRLLEVAYILQPARTVV